MTLMGGFEKDYCTLETSNLTYDIGDIDFSNPIPTAYAPHIYYAENSKDIFVTCEENTQYDVFVGFTHGWFLVSTGMRLYLELQTYGDNPQMIYSSPSRRVTLMGNGLPQKITARIMYTIPNQEDAHLIGDSLTVGFPMVISTN